MGRALDPARVSAAAAACVVVIVLGAVLIHGEDPQGRRLDRTAARHETFPPPPTPSSDPGSAEIFERKNPGSRANMGQPGRVRLEQLDDKVAWSSPIWVRRPVSP